MARLRLFTFVMLIGALLSGCVYLRLFSLKGQLAAFDEHIVLDREEGLTITFREPVLYDSDLRWMGLHPSKVAEVEDGDETHWWHWFRKVAPEPSAKGRFDLWIRTTYTDERRLKRVFIPEYYFSMVSKDLFISSLRSLGKADVDRSAKTATSEVAVEKEGVKLPSYEEIVTILGIPLLIERPGDGTTICEYRFRLERLAEETPQENEVYILRIHFDDERRMHQVKGHIPLLGEITINLEAFR